MPIKAEKRISDSDLGVSITRLESVSKIYGGRPVLEEVSMIVQQGTATALIGRNGSGKSTLLSILAGLIQPSSGRMIRKDAEVVIGYAPESFPGLKFTPEQYLHSMGRISRLAPSEVDSRLTELLEVFHLGPFRAQPMISFSKGMLQKINLIQSLLAQPDLLLLDEPMSGLDLPAQNTLVHLLRDQKQRGTAVIFSVHEPQWIEALADGVHVLQAGRTVKTIKGTGHLKFQTSTYIVCTGLSHEEELEMSVLPGFISLHAVTERPDGSFAGLTVQSSASDDFLRRVLDKGGSIVSVEPRGGLNGLEQWMNPKAAKGESAI